MQKISLSTVDRHAFNRQTVFPCLRSWAHQGQRESYHCVISFGKACRNGFVNAGCLCSFHNVIVTSFQRPVPNILHMTDVKKARVWSTSVCACMHGGLCFMCMHAKAYSVLHSALKCRLQRDLWALVIAGTIPVGQARFGAQTSHPLPAWWCH
jgi:hypothetical protein